jgi:copper chaperone
MSISPSNTTTLTVSGMTCSHCVAAVTSELSKLDRVTRVQIDLATGLVTVDSDQPVDLATMTAAVEQAGYAVASATGS